MEYLPNQNKEKFNEILMLFNYPFKTIEDINQIFFAGSSQFFIKVSNDYPNERKEFIKYFPQLIKLVKQIDLLFPQKGVPTLKTGQNAEFKMTRRHVALIFLLSFLNIFKVQKSFSKNYFDVSNMVRNSTQGSNFHFGLCFLNYLTVIGRWLEENNPFLEEIIIYKRKNINNTNYLSNLPEEKLCPINLIDKKVSLFNGNANYCIDFANKYIGGGVLNGGCVQEEILFAVDPEAIVSLFFMEVMNDGDAIGIYNIIQYSKYKGYGFHFTYEGCSIDNKTPIIKHRIIAIDAIYSRMQKSKNDLKKEINRDIHKAFVGFSFANDEPLPKTIATGNWGCGAFNGNHELKFIQQLIAASLVKLDRLDYYTFDDKNTLFIKNYYKNILNKYNNVKALYDALIKVSDYSENYIANLLSI